MKDAQTAVYPFVSTSYAHEGTNVGPSSHDNLNMLSVLHNQSVQATSLDQCDLNSNDNEQSAEEIARIAYNKMLDVPFDQVIAGKWAQVQRN